MKVAPVNKAAKWDGHGGLGKEIEMMTAEELRALRRKWVAGSFPTTGKAQAAAALVIDDLVRECFTLCEASRSSGTGHGGQAKTKSTEKENLR